MKREKIQFLRDYLFSRTSKRRVQWNRNAMQRTHSAKQMIMHFKGDLGRFKKLFIASRIEPCSVWSALSHRPSTNNQSIVHPSLSPASPRVQLGEVIHGHLIMSLFLALNSNTRCRPNGMASRSRYESAAHTFFIPIHFHYLTALITCWALWRIFQ